MGPSCANVPGSKRNIRNSYDKIYKFSLRTIVVVVTIVPLEQLD